MKSRDLLLALSLANLCMVAAWSQVLSQWTPRAYHLELSDLSVLAVMLDVLVLSLVFVLIAALVRRGSATAPWVATAAEYVLLAVLLVPLNQIRVGFNVLNTPDVAFWVRDTGWLDLVLGWTVVVLIGRLVLHSRHRLFTTTRTAVLALSPFVLITFGRGVAAMVRAPDWIPGVAATASPPQPSRTTPRQRVVVVIFDELDGRLAFASRPAGLALPTFDRLRAEGLELTQATSAGVNTMISLPIMLTGAPLTYTRPLSSGELGVRLAGADTALKPFHSLPNLFTVAQADGIRAGIAGWYHPYCRLLWDVVPAERCSWEPIYREFGRSEHQRHLIRSMSDYLLALSPWHEKITHIDLIHTVMERALALARDPSIDLAVLHLPVPHLPPVYDRATGSFTIHRYKLRGYIDQLALADSLLAEVERAIGESQAAGRTALIVTSDHPWRQSRFYDGGQDPRVPLLIRLPPSNPLASLEREPGSQDSRAITTLVIYDLVLALLRGDTRSTADLRRWLDARDGTPHIVRTSRR